MLDVEQLAEVGQEIVRSPGGLQPGAEVVHDVLLEQPLPRLQPKPPGCRDQVALVRVEPAHREYRGDRQKELRSCQGQVKCPGRNIRRIVMSTDVYLCRIVRREDAAART